MSNIVLALILFLTVLLAMGLGIVTSYGAINGVLYAFAYRSRHRSAPVPTLIPRENPVSGD